MRGYNRVHFFFCLHVHGPITVGGILQFVLVCVSLR